MIGEPLLRTNHNAICGAASGAQSKTAAQYENANRAEQNRHQHQKRAAHKSHWHRHGV
jgi:hypothetical protein